MGRHGGRAHYFVFWSRLESGLGPRRLGRLGSRQGGSSRPAGSANDAWSPFGPRARVRAGQVKLLSLAAFKLCGGGVGLDKLPLSVVWMRCGTQTLPSSPRRRCLAQTQYELPQLLDLASSASSSTPLLPTLASRGVSTAPPSVREPRGAAANARVRYFVQHQPLRQKLKLSAHCSEHTPSNAQKKALRKSSAQRLRSA